MIIWIASYPKSGNTWVRAIISSLIYSHNGVFDFELLKKIQQFPNRKHFENFTQKFQDINELKKFWVAAQDWMNLSGEIKFLKTHHINCKIGAHSFTNNNNTLGTIYVVRDPRNLVGSFVNYYQIDKNAAKNFITSKASATGGSLGNKQNNVFTILGSWNDHYKSWKKMNRNLLIIKYENLISNPYDEINRIVRFLEKFVNFNYDDKKIKNIIESTSLKKMKKMELEKGFDEASSNKINFFNLGSENKWERYLNNDEVNYITNKLATEMKELGYV